MAVLFTPSVKRNKTKKKRLLHHLYLEEIQIDLKYTYTLINIRNYICFRYILVVL